MAEPAFLTNMKTKVHSAAVQSPAGQSPAFLEAIKQKVAHAALGPVPEAARRSAAEAQTQRSITDPNFFVPELPPGGAAIERPFQPQDAPAAIADKASRLQMAHDLGLAGRVAIEGAGMALGGGLGEQAVKGAGQGLLKTAAPVVGRALGTGFGALLSQPIDPVQDPWGNAAYAAGFSGIADAVAGTLIHGFLNKAPQDIQGARDAMRLLGPGNLPTAGRLSSGRVTDVFENISEASLVGNRIEQRNLRAQNRALQLIRGFAQKLAGTASRQDVDKLVKDIVDQRHGAFSEAARSLYGKVDEVAPLGVGTDELIQLRNSIVTEHQTGDVPDGMKRLVLALDRTLGVPEASRGIEANVMLSTDTPLPRWDPKAGGRVPVLTGGQALPRPAGIPAELAAGPEQSVPIPDGYPDPYSAPSWSEGGPIEIPTRQNGAMVQDPPLAKASISFREAQKLRTDALSAQRSIADPMPGQFEGAASRVAGTTDEAMTHAASGFDNPQAFEFWRLANQFYKDGADAFGEPVMQALMNSRPDDAFQIIMQGNHPEQIARFRKLVLGGTGTSDDTAATIRETAKRTLRDPSASPVTKELAQSRLGGLDDGKKAWDTFQGQFFARVLRGADPGSGISVESAKGTRVLHGGNALDAWNAVGKDTLHEIFPNAGKKRMAERLLHTLEIIQEGTGFAGGKLAMQLGQARGMFDLVLSMSVKTGANAAMLVLGPLQLGRLLDNESFIRWATIGRKAKPGSEEAVRAFSRMAAIGASVGARVVTPDGQVVDPNRTTGAQRRFRETVGAASQRGGN